MKQKAIRKLRHAELDFPSGNAYKKLLCSWDICDWSFRSTLVKYIKREESIIKMYENRQPTDDDRLKIIENFKKYYIRK